MSEDPADAAGVTNFLSYRDGAIRRGPSEHRRRDELNCLHRHGDIGRVPCGPHWGDQFASFHQDNGPGGELCGQRPNDQLASFLRTDAIGRAPHEPRRDV